MSVRPIGMTRDKLLESNDGLCWRCLMKEAQHLNHVVPRKQGGSDHWANLWPLCPKCHYAFNNRVEREYRYFSYDVRYNISTHLPLAEWIKTTHAELEDGWSPLINFTDLRITNLNHRKSERMGPDKDVFRFYFRLSAEPNDSWQKLFELVRKWERETLWHKARVDGRHIIIECPLNEIDAHKAELDGDVANANYEYSRFGDFWPSSSYGEPEQVREDRSSLMEIRHKLGYGDHG